MTKNDLGKLKAKLPSDGVKQIAEDTGFSQQYINAVLGNRRRINTNIIDSAIKIASKYQNSLIDKTEKINAL